MQIKKKTKDQVLNLGEHHGLFWKIRNIRKAMIF
jgi:hypothetical protein